MTSVDIVSVNPGSWLVEGNIVTDELNNLEDYILTNSNLNNVLASDEGPEPTIGDTCIKITTPGEASLEGIQEQPATVDVDIGDSVWHSLYIRGSGTVILQSLEHDSLGDIIQTVSSSPLVLTSVDQELYINTVIGNGSLISFKVVTNSIQSVIFNINGVYVNKGETSRTGQNLVSDNIAFTGQDGSTDGFMPDPNPGDVVISVLPYSDKLEMIYQIP